MRGLLLKTKKKKKKKKNKHTAYKHDFCVFAGDRGLEVRGHGGRSYVPVDLCDSLCGGHPGPVSPACFPKANHSHSAA